MVTFRKVRDVVLETPVLTSETVNLSPLHSHETEGLFPKVHLTTIKITFVYSTTEEQCLDGIFVTKFPSISTDYAAF